MALTGSAKALSQSTVAVALLSWLPCTITTTGKDSVCREEGDRNGLWGKGASPMGTHAAPAPLLWAQCPWLA